MFSFSFSQNIDCGYTLEHDATAQIYGGKFPKSLILT